MKPFNYNNAKKTAEANKTFAPGKKNATIIGSSAKLNKNDNPMLIVRFRIEDGEDVDDGKELPGFINFVMDDRSLKTIEDFCFAVGMTPESEFGTNEIDVPFLTAWGERLLGETITIDVKYTKPSGDFAAMALAQGYSNAGSQTLPRGVTPIDLD